jgi:hypothetical protein
MMRIEEKDGIRILYPNYGYWLKNIETGDIHTGKIYLGVNASPDNYKEVRDETVNDSLFDTIVDVQNKERSLNKIGKIVANNVTDDAVALTIQEFYDIWEVGATYEVGRYLQYKSVLYKVLQPHTSQEIWTPDVATSVYAKVLIDPTGETIPEWEQPDSTNAYMTGDKVRFEGVVYESTMDNNIWSPTAYPQAWRVVEEG